jgi:alpha-L-rhamnosidase
MKRNYLNLFFLLLICQAAFAVEPYALTCEYINNPLGIDNFQPVLGWKLSSGEQNQSQTAYEIQVALSENDLAQGKNLVWKTGKKLSSQRFNIPYGGKKLQPFTRYYWKIRAYDKDGNVGEWSSTASFETAMLYASDWQAQWISDGSTAPQKEEDFYKDNPAPAFRKTFSAKKQVKQARLYITGLGYYEAALNGQPVGDRKLEPGWTNYNREILYSVYDITPLLLLGENTIDVVLGNGWYNPLPLKMWGHRNLRNHLTVGQPCFIAQLRITYTDGSHEAIITDESWKTTPSPILRNNIYLGEHYDARKELPEWKPAVKITPPTGKLTAQMQPPVRITKIIKPTRMTEVRPGTFIFDMGQNMAGIVRIKVKGEKGTTIRLRYGEDIYSDGSLNVMTSVAGQIKNVWNDGWNKPGQPPIAWQEDSYTLKGEGIETWSPSFTFHGFRYVEITGWPGSPTLDNLEALRMNSDLARAGTFECSNPMLNKLDSVLNNTFLSNVFSVQSDCPAREKFGYGGDIVATVQTFFYFYDMNNFYRKVLRDLANDQRPGGGITETAPFMGHADEGIGEEGLPGSDKIVPKYYSSTDETGPIGWQLAFAYLQKQLYEYYGDIRPIQTYYPALLKQVEYLRNKSEGNIYPLCLNDHESLEERISPLFATAHYYHHVILLAKFAQMLNKTDDARKYARLANDIKQAFIHRFVTSGTGEVGNHTQAAQAFGLFYDLLPENEKQAAFNLLLQEIEKRDGHIATGIFGTPLVLDALVKHNRNDIAYSMVTKKDFPGWGYMLANGATTLWETWAYSDNIYSQNHPMFGSVGEWFYRGILGINAVAPAFRKIILKPHPAGDLTWAKGSYESPYGTISSSWKKENGRFIYDISVPVGVTAEVWLPSAEAENGYTITETGSGKYHFETIYN